MPIGWQGGFMPEDGDFYKDLVDNLYDGVYFVDRERVITYWNQGAERITGYEARCVIGHSCRDNLLNHLTASGVLLCEGQCPLVACMQEGKVHEAEVFLHHADGHRLPVLVRASPLRDASGSIIGAVEIFSDNTGLVTVRNKLREVRQVTRTDMLTGLCNRRYLQRQLRIALMDFQQEEGAVGLLFIDIDNFKQINDIHGHEAGDKVLRMVSNTLHGALRTTDVLGRWGGEEFLAIINTLVSLDALRFISEKLITLVELSRLDLPNTSLTVTISVGATLFRPDDTPDSIISRADALMYKSKGEGRNRVSVG